VTQYSTSSSSKDNFEARQGKFGVHSNVIDRRTNWQTDRHAACSHVTL